MQCKLKKKKEKLFIFEIIFIFENILYRLTLQGKDGAYRLYLQGPRQIFEKWEIYFWESWIDRVIRSVVILLVLFVQTLQKWSKNKIINLQKQRRENQDWRQVISKWILSPTIIIITKCRILSSIQFFSLLFSC